jgi:5-(carboxyamino)imidazole ribonucleotide mutase
MPGALHTAPLVGVIMGSKSDYSAMRAAVEMLREFGVPYEARVVSAHRTPERMFSYADTAAARGLRVIIAGAGGAAHLPGMVAAKTVLPVLGVPIAATALQAKLVAWRAGRRDEVLAQTLDDETLDREARG